MAMRSPSARSSSNCGRALDAAEIFRGIRRNFAVLSRSQIELFRTSLAVEMRSIIAAPHTKSRWCFLRCPRGKDAFVGWAGIFGVAINFVMFGGACVQRMAIRPAVVVRPPGGESTPWPAGEPAGCWNLYKKHR